MTILYKYPWQFYREPYHYLLINTTYKPVFDTKIILHKGHCYQTFWCRRKFWKNKLNMHGLTKPIWNFAVIIVRVVTGKVKNSWIMIKILYQIAGSRIFPEAGVTLI